MITVESRNIAVFYSSVNTRGKHDATGAFIPEALAFQAVNGVPKESMFGIDCVHNTPSERRNILKYGLLRAAMKRPLDGIAFLCHGWPDGIQFGLRRRELSDFVGWLSCQGISTVHLDVTIYACSTAENDVKDRDIKNIGPAVKGGFADCLANTLGAYCYRGHVDAHKTRGHTTTNPYWIRFIVDSVESRPSWIVEPKSELWYNWVRALRGTNLRFEFPFMTELEIKTELSGLPG